MQVDIESLNVWTQSQKDDTARPGFLDLPKELRNIVYDFAFQVSGVIFIYCSDPYAYRPVLRGKIVRYKKEGPSEPQEVKGVIPTNLLAACRQTYAESAEFLYGKNIFRLYMSSVDFAPSSRHLVRHISFQIEAGRGIYNPDLEVMSYWWRRVFWPNIIERSETLLDRYPNLETLTFPIKSDQVGVTWRPPFLAAQQKSKEHRVALAARWLAINCPIKDERLRRVLHLEIMPSNGLSNHGSEGSGSYIMEEDAEFDEFDGTELADAFQQMKSYLNRQV